MSRLARILTDDADYPRTKTPPWEHQVVAWNLAKEYNEFYYAFDMGAGKTKSAIDYANGREAKVILVTCPKSVIEVWPDQFRQHSHTNYLPIVPPKKYTCLKKAEYIDGKLKIAAAGGRPCFVVLNLDVLWRPPLGPTYSKKNRIVRNGLLRTVPWHLMIVDEAHRIKSPSGNISWAAAHIGRQAQHRLALSGTPFAHSPMDIYGQFRYLNPELYPRSFTQFRAKFAKMVSCDTGKTCFNKIVGYQNLEELNTIFYRRAYRVHRKDVFDLPKVQHEVRYVDLEGEAKRVYDNLERHFVAEVEGGEITVQNALTKLLRLAQITGGHLVLDDGTHKDIGAQKMDVLKDILMDLPPEEPVVIFTRFTRELQRAKDVCMHKDVGRSVAELSGHENQLADWQQGRFNALAVQIQSGGEGVDLTRARYVIYLSKGFSLGKYEQSLARTDRPGQTREGVFFHILCRGTVDIREYQALAARRRVVEAVMANVREHKKPPVCI